MNVRFCAGLLMAALVLGGCERIGQAIAGHTNEVARADGLRLEVDEAARILAANPELPPDTGVVRALAEFWTDYTLLGLALAKDSALTALDLSRIVRPAVDQILFRRLQETAIRADTGFSDADIARRWAQEGPGQEVRARHILLRLPPSATPAQRDSVRRLAEQLRARLARGEDFATLARQYSQDPGSAGQGGDLGFFARGQMVRPFEEAVFAATPGQVGIVESPFGVHIFRVEERRTAPLAAAQRAEFVARLKQEAMQRAEQAFLDSLTRAYGLRLEPRAAALLQEVALRPGVAAKGRQGQRVLARFRGGELTVAEVAEELKAQPAPVREQLAQSDTAQLRPIVERLAQREILRLEAERRGLRLTPTQRDSLLQELRGQILRLAQEVGLPRGAPGRPVPPDTVKARVETLLTRVVQGQAQVVPLGSLGSALRDLYGATIRSAAFPKVVAAWTKLRGPNRPAGTPAPGTPRR